MSKPQNTNIFALVKEWFRYHFFERKLNSVLGIAIFAFLAVFIGYYSNMLDYRIGLGIAGVFAVFLIIIAFFRYPYFALYTVLVYSAFPAILSRMLIDSSVKIEFSNITDILTILLACSVFTKPEFRKKLDVDFWGNSISITFLILLLFYVLEALNPSMKSLLGWISFMRKYLIVFLSFYILFRLLNSWRTIRFFIYFNIVLTTLLALYSCKQQWFGLTNFEMRWATATPVGFAMLLQGGLLRKWSTLSDPAASGILFSSVTIQCLVLFLRIKNIRTKIFLAIAMIINMLGYAYSGTRTATLMVVAGIAFYGVSTIYEKRTMAFLIVAVGAFIILMVMPYSPPAIGRIRSTFDGTKDMSASVREYDRQQILPYLYQHPLGGGIFTCGIEGPKYNPTHYLVDFQPDSGYMKVFAEQGWIGFAILLATYFLIMSQAVHTFYKLRNPDLQNHCIALIAMIFTLMVGQFSQFALGPYPQILSYLGALVFFIKLPSLDDTELDS